MFAKARLRSIVSLVLWIAIAYFFVVVLRQVDRRAVLSHRLNLSLALLVLLAGTANRFLLPVVWTMVLSSLEGKPMQTRVLLWPYAESWMARYLPGKVGFIGTRAGGRADGYSRVNAIISGGVEAAAGRLVTALSVIFLSLGSRSSCRSMSCLSSRRGGSGVSSRRPFFAASLTCTCICKENRYARLGLPRRLSVAAVALSDVCRADLLDCVGRKPWPPGHRAMLLFLRAIFVSSIAGMVAFFAGRDWRESWFVQVLQPWFAKEEQVSFAIFGARGNADDLLFVFLARLLRSA
jgi:hypothetical protein